MKFLKTIIIFIPYTTKKNCSKTIKIRKNNTDDYSLTIDFKENDE